MTIIAPVTPEIQKALQISMLSKGLAFELNTGMRMSNRVNYLKIVKDLGFKGRTKVDALKWLVETQDAPVTDSVVKAFQKHGLEVILTPAE